MYWLALFFAGLFEIAWAVGLKYTDGFTRFWPSLGTALAMLASVTLLGWSLKALPLGTAYAVWTGIGVIGSALLGIVLFAESVSFMRLASIVLIMVGVAGLKLATPA